MSGPSERGAPWTEERGTSDEGSERLEARRQRGVPGGPPPGLALPPDEIVAELRDGMTIGIGGWGSRRKPMALVRAILRSDLKDLSLVAYGGADVGLLCAAGKVKRVMYAFVSLD